MHRISQKKQYPSIIAQYFVTYGEIASTIKQRMSPIFVAHPYALKVRVGDAVTRLSGASCDVNPLIATFSPYAKPDDVEALGHNANAVLGFVSRGAQFFESDSL